MAQATSYVSLATKTFPSKFEDVFVARSQSSKQNAAAEKVMITGADRRQRIVADDREPYGWLNGGYPGIGLLRMEFNGTPFIGTASIFANGTCLLTCAHNVVDYDVTTKEFVYATNVWFELRNNMGSGSALIKRYQVTKIAVYPPYFKDPTSGSGFDLALCWIEPDHVVKELYSKYHYHMPDPIAGAYSTYTAAVVGFPGEKAGEKWGMVVNIPDDKREDWRFDTQEEMDWLQIDREVKEKEILVYQFIDTSPGQSGSPVMAMKASDILGVHTGGSSSLKKNWATYLTPAKLKWIADSLGSPWTIVNDYYTLYLRERN